MNSKIPDWAFTPATSQDRQRTRVARDLGVLQIRWPDARALKKWARKQNWPAPWIGFKDAFTGKMLESDEAFAQALADSGVELLIPIERYAVPDEQLREFDALYDERSPAGQPTGWGILVEELRALRRLVEAGIVVEVDGRGLKSFGSFYSWAHGRYHMLEDGSDHWIGDDRS